MHGPACKDFSIDLKDNKYSNIQKTRNPTSSIFFTAHNRLDIAMLNEKFFYGFYLYFLVGNLTFFLLFLSHCCRSPYGTYSSSRKMGSELTQQPSMLTIFLW